MMNPGTSEFRTALLSSLEKESSRRSLGPVTIVSEEWVSRNTIVYRCRMGAQRFVAKAQATKPAAVVMAEYDMLQDMARRFRKRRVRGLRPVAMFPDLGVLVTEEEDGKALRELVEEACVGSKRQWVEATSAVEASAVALHLFHDTYGERSDPDTAGMVCVRWYMDFSPKNVLVKSLSEELEVPEVVLMDPPEEEKWKARTEDIGGFCYDLARTRYLPRFIWRPAVSRKIDWFKARFIHSYYQAAGDQYGEQALEHIKEAEYRRATQALKWYLTPWRYNSVLKETLRLCYLGPLTATYRVSGIHRSHSNVRRLLNDEAVGWELSEAHHVAT